MHDSEQMAASFYVKPYTYYALSLFGVQHRYEDIVKWYQDLADKFPSLIRFVPSIGKSYEGRDQPAVHITSAAEPTKNIYFQCQIHASKC